MKTHLTIALGILMITIQFSCKPDSNNLKEFYFPIEGLKDGLVYEYKSLGDNNAQKHFWFYKTHSDKGKQYLSAQYYNASGAVEQYTLEEITKNRTLAKEYRLVSYDTTGRMFNVNVEISKNQIFPYGKPDPEAIQRFKINWKDPVQTQYTNQLNRGRAFQQFTQHDYKGKPVKCAEFIMVETIEIEEEGQGVQTLETTTKELYAQGIGLVYSQKKIGAQTLFTYQLTDRFSMENFEQRFKDEMAN